MPSYIGFPCKLRKLPTRLEIPPGLKNMECMSNMNNWKLTPNDMNELGLIRFLSHSSLVAYLAKGIYPISSFSFRGNYSFLNLSLCTVTFDHSTYRCGNYSREEIIQGRKLFAEIRYIQDAKVWDESFAMCNGLWIVLLMADICYTWYTL